VKTYSESFKKKMVQRLLMPNGPTATALSAEVGVPQPTLSMWKRKAGTVVAVSNNNRTGSASGPRRPEDWSAQERLRVVNESSRLSEVELGEFLRREGLHEETVAAWRKAALEGLQAASAERARGGDRKRMKQLERELARKDKALAEAAALLVLKKKAQAIWGDEDDDTSEESEK
jgi:transposase-like protein